MKALDGTAQKWPVYRLPFPFSQSLSSPHLLIESDVFFLIESDVFFFQQSAESFVQLDEYSYEFVWDWGRSGYYIS